MQEMVLTTMSAAPASTVSCKMTWECSADRVLFSEVDDGPIVHVEPHGREEQHLAVTLPDGHRGDIVLVFHVCTHLFHGGVREPVVAQNVVQVEAVVGLRLSRVDDDGAVALHEHGSQQYHLRFDLVGFDEGVRIDHAAQYAHDFAVFRHRFGDAVEVPVQPVRLANLRPTS